MTATIVSARTLCAWYRHNEIPDTTAALVGCNTYASRRVLISDVHEHAHAPDLCDSHADLTIALADAGRLACDVCRDLPDGLGHVCHARVLSDRPCPTPTSPCPTQGTTERTRP